MINIGFVPKENNAIRNSFFIASITHQFKSIDYFKWLANQFGVLKNKLIPNCLFLREELISSIYEDIKIINIFDYKPNEKILEFNGCQNGYFFEFTPNNKKKKYKNNYKYPISLQQTVEEYAKDDYEYYFINNRLSIIEAMTFIEYISETNIKWIENDFDFPMSKNNLIYINNIYKNKLLEQITFKKNGIAPKFGYIKFYKCQCGTYASDTKWNLLQSETETLAIKEMQNKIHDFLKQIPNIKMCKEHKQINEIKNKHFMIKTIINKIKQIKYFEIENKPNKFKIILAEFIDETKLPKSPFQQQVFL